MRKTFRVALREYLENLTTKTFWIGIFSFPVILVLSLVIPVFLEKAKDVRKFAVIDHSGWVYEAIQQQSMARDMAIVFSSWGRKANAGENGTDSIPAGLRDLFSNVSNLDPQFQQQVAQWTALGEPDAVLPEALDPALRDSLRQNRDALAAWWRALTPEQARRISLSLDRAQYQEISAAHGDEKKLSELIEREALFAYFVISADPVMTGNGCKYVSNNFTDQELKNWFAGLANSIVQKKRFEVHDIDQVLAQEILQPLGFEFKKVTKAGEEEEVAMVDKARQWVPVAFVYILWISVFTIAQMLLTNTVEEKSNRIIEVLLSSVSPLQLMSGKVFGIAATGLTVIASWILFFFYALKFTPMLMGHALTFDLSFVFADPVFLVGFVAYFFLGYLFYAALLVGMGSVCNSLKEAQNLMMPVVIILMVPLFTMMPVGQDPNGPLAKILSYIPPFTPFVMMNRAAGPPTVMEYVITTLLLIGSIAFVFWASAKVFRIGILMTGKPPRFREILTWIRTPIGAIPDRRDSQASAKR